MTPTPRRPDRPGTAASADRTGPTGVVGRAGEQDEATRKPTSPRRSRGAGARGRTHDVDATPSPDVAETAPVTPHEPAGRQHATRRGRRTPLADAAFEPGATPSRGERVGAALRTWRGELAETGGPNALLWYRDSPDGTLDLTKAHPTGGSMLMAGNAVLLSHLVREPTAFANALLTARRIRDKADELREDHGLDTGCVGIGMASWQLPGASAQPQAPIMLRTCRLHAVDAAQTDLELELSTEVELNPVLLHYMASEQGIRLDAHALTTLATATGRFDPLPVYRELKRHLGHVSGFTITDRRVMSTFATTKMAMVADLAAFAALLGGNDLVAALAGDPAAAAALHDDGEGGLADSARRPAEADLDRELLVLDADPAQTEVIDAARSGRHVLLDAPTGTGVTQTLANVAAALVGSDQRVLVVAEPARQLDAFVSSLTSAGMGDLILDARDPSALRRTLAADLLSRVDAERTAARTGADSAQAGPAAATPEQTLAGLRGRLAAHHDCLHAPRRPWGVSVFDAQTALARLAVEDDAPTSRVRIAAEHLAAVDRPGLDRIVDDLGDLAQKGAWTFTPDDDPWWAARLDTDEDVLRALGLATELARDRFADDRATLDRALVAVGLPAARTMADWDRAFALLAQVHDTLASFHPEVYTRRLDDFIAATAPERRSDDPHLRWWARNGLKRDARALLLPDARVDVHEGMRAAVAQRAAWSAATGSERAPHLPEAYDEAHSRWRALRDDLAWLDTALETTRDGGGLLGQPLDEVQARLARLAGRPDRIAVIPATRPGLQALTRAGWGDVVDDLAQRHVKPGRIRTEAEFVWWCSLLDVIAQEDAAYGQHDGQALRDLLAAYVAAEDHRYAERARSIVARARAHARVEISTRPDQVNALREAARPDRAPRQPRSLLADVGDIAAALCPIWVMSPLTLASVVPTHLTFDVILVDDAHRMPVAHAISALARGVRVVAAGDLQGLGPAAFETVAAAEADPDDPVDDSTDAGSGGPSLLAELARHLPVRHLRRTYGDQDARIAAFPLGRREEAIATQPTAGRETAYRMVRTDVVLSSADDAAIAAEREAVRVAELVLEHARREPDRSLAVVTLVPGQATRIDTLLRAALAGDPESAASPAFAEGTAERFYVTPLDRAVGRSRDTIVLATGVVPTLEETLTVPERLTRADGAAAVDAIAALARRRLVVVSAVTASDVARLAAPGEGADRLAELLDHAERDGMAAAPAGVDRHALVAELAARLRMEGLAVHEGYGVGPERLDLAVEDPYVPGRLVAAVLTDGERDASLATIRERSRLVPRLLERRGWRCVRVWSTDVFRDPARDVARVVEAVRSEE